MKNKIPAFAFVLLSLFAAASNASLLEVDYLAAGDKLLTRDTISDIEWLDLTQTTSISYTDMQGRLGPGGQYEGFRYATVADIDRLQVNAGLRPGLFLSTSPVEINIVIELLDKLGITIPPSQSGSYSSWGITSTPFGPTSTIDDRIMRDFRISSGGVAMSANQGVINDLGASSQVGNWLIRETPSPVPLPGGLILFLSGIALLFGFKRRRN